MKNLEIERLRAWAILLVLVQHMPVLKAVLPAAFRAGGTGVDLFFVISGYVVSRSLLGTLTPLPERMPLLERIDRARPALAAFLSRRIHRILPMALLWAVIPLVLSFALNTSGVFGDAREVAGEVFAILSLQYNYAMTAGNGLHLAWYWSLAVEEHFYLLLPLFMVVFATASRRIVAAAAGIAIVAFLLRPFSIYGGPPELAWTWNFVSHRNFDYLFAGVLLHLLREQGYLEIFRAMPRGWALALTQGALLGIWLDQGLMPPTHFFGAGQLSLEAFAAVAVLEATFERNVVLPIPGLTRALEWLGSRSYGVYLIHQNVLHLGTELLARRGTPPIFAQVWQNTGANVLIVTGVTFGLAELCFRLLERPLIARGHRITAALLRPARTGALEAA
jgi:peptidoglycan/LPS O-acetylase OafA/YrhL